MGSGPLEERVEERANPSPGVIACTFPESNRNTGEFVRFREVEFWQRKRQGTPSGFQTGRGLRRGVVTATTVGGGPWTVDRGSWGRLGTGRPDTPPLVSPCTSAPPVDHNPCWLRGRKPALRLSNPQINPDLPTWRHSPPAPSHDGKMFTSTGDQRQKPQNRLKSPSRFGRQTRDRPFLTQNPGLVPPEHLLECTSAFSRTPRRGTVPLRCC